MKTRVVQGEVDDMPLRPGEWSRLAASSRPTGGHRNLERFGRHHRGYWDTMRPDLLATYLHNHWAGATSGVALFARAADHHRDTAAGAELLALGEEVQADREALRTIMHDLAVTVPAVWSAVGWAAEKAGRLKSNGYLMRRSPLSDVVELEALRGAVALKAAGWDVLRSLVPFDGRLDPDRLDELVDRAHDQSTRLRTLHVRLADARLGGR